ncbi:MAG: hypothetical protein KDA81_22260, partial [Planctomycetaceae bacterium]|nr:hypothetical protein [Planctomycetaceae bacterium]
VFAELQISVDGRPYRLWVTEFLSRRVDRNNDGQLTATEVGLIPERLLLQTSAADPVEAVRMSGGQSASSAEPEPQVSCEDFASWFANELLQSFNIIAGAVQASDAVRLAALIDADQNGSVSEAELQTARHSLRFRDLDDDQTFTAAELMPFRDPRNQQAAVVPDVANLPFVQLSDDDSIRRAADQIVKRYGKDGAVSRTVLRLSESEPSQESMTSNDLIEFLRNPDHHLHLHVQLADAANASDVEIEIAPHARTFCSAESERRGRLKLSIDDMPIDLRARGGSQGARTMMVNFLLQRMATFDSDKSGYLSEDEFPALQQAMSEQLQIAADFGTVDINGDEMLLRDEVSRFIERDMIATQSQIEVSVRQDGKTLFKILDANRDRRLSPRELNEGFQQLAEYDRNDDHNISESELGTAYALQIGLGQTATLRIDSMSSMNRMAEQTDAVLPGIEGLAGPEWFRRMDRNQDRDVSWREFPGTRTLFDQLDTNHDQLISADEAEQLQGPRP